MDIIFKYDVSRLNAFQQRDCNSNNIAINNTGNAIVLSFPAVRYFNYAFLRTGDVITEETVVSINDSYRSKDIHSHRIIVDAGCDKSNSVLLSNRNYQASKQLVKTKYTHGQSIRDLECNEDIRLTNVHADNLLDFTSTYLRSFESENIDYLNVKENFKHLLDIPNTSLYLLMHKDQPIGVNVLYHHDGESLVAGGAVLKEYRGKGFHKMSISERISKCLNLENSHSIYSSAYNNSISLHNMHTMSMKTHSIYNIYEYCR